MTHLIKTTEDMEFQLWSVRNQKLVFMRIGIHCNKSVVSTFDACSTVKFEEAEVGLLNELAENGTPNESTWEYESVRKMISEAIQNIQKKQRIIESWKPVCKECGEELLEDSEIFDGICLECQETARRNAQDEPLALSA